MNEVIIYQAPDNTTQIDVRFENNSNSVWLTQGQLVDLFDSSKANISEHIKKIYGSGELEKESTVRKEGNRNVSREPKQTVQLIPFN